MQLLDVNFEQILIIWPVLIFNTGLFESLIQEFEEEEGERTWRTLSSL